MSVIFWDSFLLQWNLILCVCMYWKNYWSALILDIAIHCSLMQTNAEDESSYTLLDKETSHYQGTECTGIWVSFLKNFRSNFENQINIHCFEIQSALQTINFCGNYYSSLYFQISCKNNVFCHVHGMLPWSVVMSQNTFKGPLLSTVIQYSPFPRDWPWFFRKIPKQDSPGFS